MFAHERLPTEIPEAERAGAVRRMVGGWMALTETAHKEIYGGTHTIVAGRANGGIRRRTKCSGAAATRSGGWRASRTTS
ncbi:hypothetical protein WKI71_44625 [Streptomyces sp. MS1.AVA.1]|uniref:Uncharacterized protein n=1 Tax=Streptomyces machairae TaxID=3134109 RepID=A0ABU8UVH0_9ACTN